MCPIHVWCAFLLLFTMGISVPSLAGEPTEKIRETTDKILAIITDPCMKPPEKITERNRLIREAVDDRFDWGEMARRSLGRHWRKRTGPEKKEFVNIYGDLLEQTYMGKVGDYSGEKVVYVAEKVEGDYGIVKVKIANHNDREIPVMYRLKKKGKDWLVYDISIEGVSFVNNYRTQFNSIIVRSSYNKLVEKLKAKVKKN